MPSAVGESSGHPAAYSPPSVTDLGADPFLEALRDVLGALRIVYAASTDERAPTALKKAGDAVTLALEVGDSKRREKELPLALRRARTAIREASEAVPAHAEILGGALARVPTMRSRRR